jgi:hypothetical protein
VDQLVLRSQDLPYKGQAMAVGDFTGDGTMKVAVSDGQGVYIYELETGGLKELWSTPGYTSDNIVALDAADINQNGTAEILNAIPIPRAKKPTAGTQPASAGVADTARAMSVRYSVNIMNIGAGLKTASPPLRN